MGDYDIPVLKIPNYYIAYDHIDPKEFVSYVHLLLDAEDPIYDEEDVVWGYIDEWNSEFQSIVFGSLYEVTYIERY